MTAAVPDVAQPWPGDPPPQPQWRPMKISFTGSGSEYFRIWIVNLLLTVLTLSLYLPYARARRLRYFHGNTWVDGHALGFHGSGHTMLRGHLLVLLFTGVYAAAGWFSPWAAGVSGLALVLLWPALWQASLRFRLANTSWRGLRLRFTGTVSDAYRCLWPGLVPAGLLLLLTALRSNRDANAAAAPLVGAWADVAIGACGLLLLLAMPILLMRLKRYQHGHYHFAGDTSALSATRGDFIRLWLRGGGLTLAGIAALALVVGGSAYLLREIRPLWEPHTNWAVGVWATAAVVLILALNFSLQAWFAARLQNLVWGRTASPRLRFGARLRALDLATLSLKNLLLTVLTLGMYRPFAVVATTRLRLGAVSLLALEPLDRWVALGAATSGDAAGDASGDLLGVDLGL